MGHEGPQGHNTVGTLTVARRDAAGDEVVIEVGGELDLNTVPMFIEAIDEAVEGGSPIVVLDMSSLTFIDSSGLGAYVTAFRRAKQQGSRLRIGDRSPLVDRVLEIAGIEDVLADEP